MSKSKPGLIDRILLYVHDRLEKRIRKLKARNTDFGPHVSVGRGTYGAAPDVFFKPTPNSPIRIGNYCSIALGVVFLGLSERSTRTPSLYPFRTKRLRKETGINYDAVEKGPTSVGHDVWFGRGAIVLSGVSIGTGAIIGAGAVVTKDIPPYAVAAGNPAVVRRYRFPEETIEKLLESRWWDLPESSIETLDPYFYSEDIDTFITAVKNEWNRHEQ